MRTSNLKRKLKMKEPTIGSWLSLGNRGVCEMMAKLGGFDWLVVDMEHTATDFEAMTDLIQVTDLCGLEALVRIGTNDPLLMKRALDAGAHGIIVPQVNTPDDARRAVASAYYPPRGNRGAGLFRAQGYSDDFESYRRWAETEITVFVQIEHHEGVANLEEIMAVDGIDGFLIGPYDLSASLGHPGDFTHPDVEVQLARLADYARHGSKPAGIHVVSPDAAHLRRRLDEGFVFIAYGTDMLFLSERLTQESGTVRTVNGE
ncbi:MAG: aldolase/citrate lyase family protein [Rhodospirillales bacterium]|tara:strand:- start:8815 stop:9594 length:780 start_codon:yes stop_codon:yes gene_type:complete